MGLEDGVSLMLKAEIMGGWWNLYEQFQTRSPNIWGCYFAFYEQNNPRKWSLRTRCGGPNCRRSVQALAHMLCHGSLMGCCSQFSWICILNVLLYLFLQHFCRHGGSFVQIHGWTHVLKEIFGSTPQKSPKNNPDWRVRPSFGTNKPPLESIVSLRIYIYMYMYIYVYAYMYVYTDIYTKIYIRIYVYILCIYAYTARLYKYVRKYVIHICVCIYIHVLYVHICMYTYIYVCIHLYIYTHISMCIYTHTYICIRNNAHTHIYICNIYNNTYVYITYTNTYTRMYIYTHIYTQTYTRSYKHTHTYVHVHINILVHVHVVTNVYLHTYTFVHEHSLIQPCMHIFFSHHFRVCKNE